MDSERTATIQIQRLNQKSVTNTQVQIVEQFVSRSDCG